MVNIKIGTQWRTKPELILDTCTVNDITPDGYVEYITSAGAKYIMLEHRFHGTWEPVVEVGALAVPKPTTADTILEAAAGHMRDRAATYDKQAGERSMGATVQAFKAITGHDLTEEQGWLFMQVLKAVRSQQGTYRADSYEDGAAYVALAGEAAARDRT